MSNFWAYLKFFGLPEISDLFLWHVDDPDLAVNFDQQQDIPDEPDPPDPPDPPDGPIIGTNLPMESLSNHSERGTVIQGGVLGVQTQSSRAPGSCEHLSPSSTPSPWPRPGPWYRGKTTKK